MFQQHNYEGTKGFLKGRKLGIHFNISLEKLKNALKVFLQYSLNWSVTLPYQLGLFVR
jgi:hypothetical protein